MTIPEELFLLGIENTNGNVNRMQTNAFQYAMSGSILMELALRGKIDTDPEVLMIVDTESTQSEVLDIALNALRLQPAQSNISACIDLLNERYNTFIYAILNSLIQKGMLKIEHQKVLWVFNKLTYPIIGHDEVADVKTRVHELVFSDQIPELQDMVIISLLYYSNQLLFVLTPNEIKQERDRIEMISKMDLVGQQIGKRLSQELEVALAMAGSPMIR